MAAPSSDCIPGDTGFVHYYAFVEPMEDWHGYSRIVYGLEIKNYEVYELLKPLTAAYPDLCFVDSQLSLDDGEIMAAYVARGQCHKWILPGERREAHWEKAAREHSMTNLERAYEDDDVSSEAEHSICW
jgi:hypothetical protein